MDENKPIYILYRTHKSSGVWTHWLTKTDFNFGGGGSLKLIYTNIDNAGLIHYNSYLYTRPHASHGGGAGQIGNHAEIWSKKQATCPCLGPKKRTYATYDLI